MRLFSNSSFTMARGLHDLESGSSTWVTPLPPATAMDFRPALSRSGTHRSHSVLPRFQGALARSPSMERRGHVCCRPVLATPYCNLAGTVPKVSCHLPPRWPRHSQEPGHLSRGPKRSSRSRESPGALGFKPGNSNRSGKVHLWSKGASRQNERSTAKSSSVRR